VTRQADPNNKDNLHVRARSEAERKLIGDLKQLALQDEVELADLVFEGVALMFNVHHWPVGNPQLPLSAFQQEKEKPSDTVCTCGRPIEITYGVWEDKNPHKSCKCCFNKISSRKIQYYRLKKDEHNNK
jgi:hypothetical protein